MCSKGCLKFLIYLNCFFFAVFGLTLMALSVIISKSELAKAAGLNNLIAGYGAAFGIAMFFIGSTCWLVASKENYCFTMIVFLFDI